LRETGYWVLLLFMFFLPLGPGVLAQTTGTVVPADVDGLEPDSMTQGMVHTGVGLIHYKAIAGTLTVGSTNEIDRQIGTDGRWLTRVGVKTPAVNQPEDAPATARIFYAAYFRTDMAQGGMLAKPRPIMFLYNGGPSTASLWLHMGAFGPKRVAISDVAHQAGAPYAIEENGSTLLDVADLVFIDAPGTGYSRVMGHDAERAFWGVDQDAMAFDRFILRFLTKYDLWNHPKYLFGESYGTSRSAVMDLNGIVLMSQILSFDNSIDAVRGNPGVDQGYALELPSYTAAAFYHHKLSPQPAQLQPLLREVEVFAMGPYMQALLAGAKLPASEKQAIATQLHRYTGLSEELWLRYNLRIDVGAFDKNLMGGGTVAGRLDSRYVGPDMDPSSATNDPGLDPLGAATGPAYMAAVNTYLNDDMKYGANDSYKYMLYDVPGFRWDWHHQGPGSPAPLFAFTGTSMSLDLAFAMKRNPKMKVLLTGGYFDLGTPYFEGIYEMAHLPIPDSLQGNISYHYYETGHMIYLNPVALSRLHNDVAAFVLDSE
jgi:carboxypeptidase C (cathepsin A)